MNLGPERIGTGGLPGFWVLHLLGPGPQTGREVQGLEASTQAPDRRWPGSLLSTRCHPGWRRVGPGSLEEPEKWEHEEGTFSAAPAPHPSMTGSEGCWSVPPGVGCPGHFLPLLFLWSWALPARGCPGSKKALTKG
ncbi:hypothetical protein HJG60_010198 [Phyllostomus discolor]|uniref:Uncharacterized protein n=1 Tax=Phyllostomus discolor TaxID=89673 RepID=A0A834AXW4_9CHIR|nr:hypothetical protein HJG60_010198 [Phyllostomus discolor]